MVDILNTRFILFKSLVSKEYESKFMQSNYQFFEFIQLSTLGIEMTNILEKENCSECNIIMLSLKQKIIETFAKNCLNNYSKKCSDHMQK